MRRAEGAGADERLCSAEQARGGVKAGDLEHLLPGHRGEDSGQPFCEHTLARAGRAAEQNVVPSGCRDLERALCELLPFDLREVRDGERLGCGVRGDWPRIGLPAQQRAELRDIAHGDDGDRLGERGLGGILLREVEGAYAERRRVESHRECACDRTQRAAQGQLADKRRVPRNGGQLLLRDEQRGEDGQIVERSLFGGVSWGEVDCDAGEGEGQAAVFERGAHPVTGFAHRFAGQSHEFEGGQTAGEIGLDLHPVGPDAAETETCDFC